MRNPAGPAAAGCPVGCLAVEISYRGIGRAGRRQVARYHSQVASSEEGGSPDKVYPQRRGQFSVRNWCHRAMETSGDTSDG